MNNDDTFKTEKEEVLSEEELLMLSSDAVALVTVDVDSSQMASLRSRVMAQVDALAAADTINPITIRADTGEWKQIADKIRQKMLHIDKERGIASFLLKIEPGAIDEPHVHSSDEHCLVLEGEVSFGDIHLRAGDYHLAPKGSRHEKAYSECGALLYIQTGMEQQLSL